MITPEQIQSIVDGESTHTSRALLLRELDSQPSGWRTLALALLEEQQWSQELLRLSDSENLYSKVAANSDTEASRVRPEVGTLKLETKEEPGRRQVVPWMPALAASLLLGVGMYGGSWLPTISGGRTSPESQYSGLENRTTVSEAHAPFVSNQESDMKMLVSGPNHVTSEIPVYDLNASGHDLFVAREMYEIAKINQRLRREGYELDVRPEYYTGKLNDGRNLIVPVKHVGVKQYGL